MYVSAPPATSVAVTAGPRAQAESAWPNVHAKSRLTPNRARDGHAVTGLAGGADDCRRLELDSTATVGEWRELHVTAQASEMVTVPRAELDALRAEVRRLRREVGRSVARARMEADPGPGDGSLTMSRSELAEAWGIGE
jgi:hypothetical protein